MQIPLPWLIVSGVFFVLGSVAYITMVIVMLKMMKSVQEIQPQIKGVANRVEEISKKVDDMATSAKATTDSISGKAKHVAESFEMVALSGVEKLGKASAVLIFASTALKLFKEFQAVKSGSVDKKEG
jgi:uncharacterized protein YoxC